MIFGPARVRTNKSPGTAMGLRKVNQESLAVKPHFHFAGSGHGPKATPKATPKEHSNGIQLKIQADISNLDVRKKE